MAAWLMIAVEDRKRAGDGYDDDPSRHYSWDERVANAAAVAVGDVIALWDTKTLLGLSVIEAIEVGAGEKELRACPSCGRADVASRKTMTPEYKCWKCGTEFDQPATRRVPVKTYRSRHEAGWIDLHGSVSGAELRQLCEKPSSQLSLRRLRWDAFRKRIETGKNHMPLDILDRTREVIAGGHRKAAVRVRVGQPAFREAMLATFGEVCAFTGPTPVQALEAAHLYSYAATGKHHKGAGLLLRRDVHRLFDLGLIAFNPTTKTIDVAPGLAAYPLYAQLHGKSLAVTATGEHINWLTKHWHMHRAT
ncbi:HNH endonuclease [Actinoallomurus purpureus]|uniref:HNH endonuclease n=1 Tax=Actinoallomurus purpureus TaxID=478114 RepID=UPI002092E45A|nr:HNH endonuclease [Actinoallomurus purpureus]MCO6009259.1 HNH endonuclease [Actinoallomurus purpureus]